MRFCRVLTSLAGGCLAVCLIGAPQAQASIFIHEILADPPGAGGDANRDGVTSSSADEFIELYNDADFSVDLSGWTFSDDLRQRHVFGQGTLIGPFGVFVVFGGGAPVFPDGIFNTASSGGLGLNNTGDIVTLYDAQGLLIDQVIYGSDGGKDQSLVRFSADDPMVLYSAVSDTEKFAPGIFKEPGQGGQAAVVPEPATCLSFLAAAGGLFGLRKRRILKI